MDDQFPVIVVSTKDSYNGKIFSLFHELLHLVFKTGGIFRSFNLSSFSPDSRKIEILCNRITGIFLVPQKYLLKEPIIIKKKSKKDWTEPDLEDLSHKYKVSKEVILRRLLDLKLTNQNTTINLKIIGLQ